MTASPTPTYAHPVTEKDYPPAAPGAVFAGGLVLGVIAGVLIGYGINTDNSTAVWIGAVAGAVAQAILSVGAAAIGTRIALRYREWERRQNA